MVTTLGGTAGESHPHEAEPHEDGLYPKRFNSLLHREEGLSLTEVRLDGGILILLRDGDALPLVSGEGRRRSLDGCDTVEDDVGTSELLVAVDPSRLHTITDLVDGSRALQKSDGVITVEAEVSYRASV